LSDIIFNSKFGHVQLLACNLEWHKDPKQYLFLYVA
jgi:hypothetical protein